MYAKSFKTFNWKEMIFRMKVHVKKHLYAVDRENFKNESWTFDLMIKK